MIINNSGDKVGFYFNISNEKLYIEIDRGVNNVNFYNHLPLVLSIVCHSDNMSAVLPTYEESSYFICAKGQTNENCACLLSKKIVLEEGYTREYESISQLINANAETINESENLNETTKEGTDREQSSNKKEEVKEEKVEESNKSTEKEKRGRK